MKNKYLVLLIIILTAGCGTITALNRPISRSDVIPHIEDGYKDYRGVIHVHSIYSDGTGTYSEIAQAANKSGLDFLIITDHNTLQALDDNKEGWYGRTLILVGEEASLPEGHLLSLNVNRLIRGKTTQQTLDMISKAGGLSFIAHPYYSKAPWKDWAVSNFHGMEIYNLKEDVLSKDRLSLFLRFAFLPPDVVWRSLIERPDEALRKWDELTQKRKVVGIAGNDAHASVRILGMTFDPYEQFFRVVNTHILLPEGATLDRSSIYKALKNGHIYSVFHIFCEAKNFTFMATDGQEILIMGDEMNFSPGWKFFISAPNRKAKIKLIRNGELIKEGPEFLEHEITEEGVYRVEVYLKDRPWIFSNPIYIRPHGGPKNRNKK